MTISVQTTWDLLTCEIDALGTCRWYDMDGNLHREDGPAVIRAVGTQYWLKHGVRHRENGPAYIRPNGYVEYWFDGYELAEKEFNTRRNSNAT